MTVIGHELFPSVELVVSSLETHSVATVHCMLQIISQYLLQTVSLAVFLFRNLMCVCVRVCL